MHQHPLHKCRFMLVFAEFTVGYLGINCPHVMRTSKVATEIPDSFGAPLLIRFAAAARSLLAAVHVLEFRAEEIEMPFEFGKRAEQRDHCFLLFALDPESWFESGCDEGLIGFAWYWLDNSTEVHIRHTET